MVTTVSKAALSGTLVPGNPIPNNSDSFLAVLSSELISNLLHHPEMVFFLVLSRGVRLGYCALPNSSAT